MKSSRCILRAGSVLLFGFGVVCACAFDDTVREYLSARFWLPFAKHAWDFAKPNVHRTSAPYAGMVADHGETPLAKLRAAYQKIAQPNSPAYDEVKLRTALAAAESDQSLTAREKEEVALIDAKIDVRAGSADSTEPLTAAKNKLNAFLQNSRTPEYLSEARGWLGYVHHLLGDQTQAGKIYIDELNRKDSNLSRDVLINSLRITYGYDGGPELIEHLDEYFDTPEHAAFAIQLVTNPHWDRYRDRSQGGATEAAAPLPYARISNLLDKHRELLRSEHGSAALALLGMRTALRAGDAEAALRIASAVPAKAVIRREPDFLWMLGSAYFLSHHFAAAERPLLSLFRSSRSSDNQRAAAAYALCGVYRKTRNPVEQIRFALWLHTQLRSKHLYMDTPSSIIDQSVYWAASGWDLALLLDAEAPMEALRSFLQRYPTVPDVRLVRYTLAVRLAREDKYEESAEIYESIHARPRASRMRQLASLYEQANRTGAPEHELLEARYKLAEFISANQERLYFNDALWSGLQRYALNAGTDSRLTRRERGRLLAAERKLKDDQEERWRAYLLARAVAQEAGNTDLGRRAAELGLRCVWKISERFERKTELQAAQAELSSWLRASSQ